MPDNALEATCENARASAQTLAAQKKNRMTERVNLGKSSPDLYQAVIELDRLASEAVTHAGIEESFSHLLRLRASQINQCAFCVRLHARDALASGESSDHVAVLAAWKETDYFNPKERTALELVEAITLISNGQLPDAIYEQALEHLSKEEVSAIEWLAVVINTWNRLAISSRYPVRAYVQLTIHSSRSRFAARLNSGVRPIGQKETNSRVFGV